MTLAIDGGTPLRSRPFTPWPPKPTAEQRSALLDVLDSGAWGSTAGTRVQDFAAQFAERHEARYGIPVSNGTLGLLAALRAVGVRRDDEVIIPPFTFVATASSVLLAGAVPVFADVDPETMMLDPEAVAACVTDRTKAVVPVHLAGGAADIDAIRAAIPDRVRIVEDAAQAHGAALRGRTIGAIGDIGSFSFQSSKNMTAGEGGMLVTNDEDCYRAAWSAANVGRAPGGGWYEHPAVGWNLRLTEFQAALLTDQLGRLDELNARRDHGARVLAKRLADEVEGIRVLLDPDGTTTHARHLALLRFDPAAFGGVDKGRLAALAGAEGIPLSSGYPLLHKDAAIRAEAARIVDTECPVAESAGPLTVWLPQTVLLSAEEDLADVVAVFVKIQRALT
ncbi:MAG TPA: DegT/DnrJ/EryC1/StrS family aminotransferase [Mycobacteriales bacterium]|nr:DegT/DnrJ/EryC1/StrS family aminotransferase [Mycobacteriales bacterium]